MKREFSVVRIVLGEPISARVLPLDGGVRVEIYGGTRPHIGAVSVADSAGKITTTEFPGHREGVVAEQWAKALAAAGFCPAVVLAGIHYDSLDGEGVQKVMIAAKSMLADAVAQLKA